PRTLRFTQCKHMKVLAIETSCDETGIALIEGSIQGDALESPGVKASPSFVFTTLKAALLSQAALHAPYGGVYPNLAKREHEKNLPILFEQFADEKVDAIAVTNGPGLEPALWQGIEFAKKVSAEWRVPLIPVNHMEGHLISSLAQPQHSNILQNVGVFELKDIKLPVLALLISGGHTEFVLMRDWFVYEIIGQTLDDAVGEAFDKVARMLGLPYPGGPEISKLAEQHRKENLSDKSLAQGSPPLVRRTEDPQGLLGDKFSLKLPRPMLHTNNCDMSFSGLKTAVLYALRGKNLSPNDVKKFAREFEDAAADVLVAKTRRALLQTGAETFVLGGGVAANTHIRKQLQQLVTEEFSGVAFRLPELSITGDNAIMIAQAALAHLLTGNWQLATSNQSDIRAQGKLSLA
ncbi:MAG: tRNA (adenosine(37)-N6)-threonylcarbamoyltransferase complex transferase subunit TsaD, partial [bacterium]|nr:tRNA (adenosine(37)-N6)-threonylcarbamoyltransferase complex transferase subunit TsaD [bacterium]